MKMLKFRKSLLNLSQFFCLCVLMICSTSSASGEKGSWYFNTTDDMNPADMQNRATRAARDMPTGPTAVVFLEHFPEGAEDAMDDASRRVIRLARESGLAVMAYTEGLDPMETGPLGSQQAINMARALDVEILIHISLDVSRTRRSHDYGAGAWRAHGTLSLAAVEVATRRVMALARSDSGLYGHAGKTPEQAVKALAYNQAGRAFDSLYDDLITYLGYVHVNVVRSKPSDIHLIQEVLRGIEDIKPDHNSLVRELHGGSIRIWGVISGREMADLIIKQGAIRFPDTEIIPMSSGPFSLDLAVR